MGYLLVNKSISSIQVHTYDKSVTEQKQSCDSAGMGQIPDEYSGGQDAFVVLVGGDFPPAVDRAGSA